MAMRKIVRINNETTLIEVIIKKFIMCANKCYFVVSTLQIQAPSLSDVTNVHQSQIYVLKSIHSFLSQSPFLKTDHHRPGSHR